MSHFRGIWPAGVHVQMAHANWPTPWNESRFNPPFTLIFHYSTLTWSTKWPMRIKTTNSTVPLEWNRRHLLNQLPFPLIIHVIFVFVIKIYGFIRFISSINQTRIVLYLTHVERSMTNDSIISRCKFSVVKERHWCDCINVFSECKGAVSQTSRWFKTVYQSRIVQNPRSWHVGLFLIIERWKTFWLVY